MNWNEWILSNELPVRLSFFFALVAVMAAWELLSPRREWSNSDEK